MKKFLNQKSLPWILLFFLAVFVRFYNFENFLFFINDQGRDALKIQSIVNGDLTLIGPTSGLGGFFLGPLWFYLGVPGYIISHGSPYGISLWYIFIASLALPFFWLLSKRLFPKKESWQLLSFSLLAFLPGSINGATFVWNPLLSLPLMAAALFFLYKARFSRLFLALAFLLLGFVLHSEFAYAIFILPVFYLLIFWIRKKFSIIDYLIAGFAILITLVPQIIFELKNDFLMSKAMMKNFTTGEGSVRLSYVFEKRPAQLFAATRELLFSRSSVTDIFTILAIGIIIYGIYRVWKTKKYEWQIIALVTILPYLGYMFWKGNYGHFFSYYMTPHFIPLILMFTYGLFEINQHAPELLKKLSFIIVIVLFTFSYTNIHNLMTNTNNEAGLKSIDLAVQTTLGYFNGDRLYLLNTTPDPISSTVLTFTPNYLTAQYDFTMEWRAKKQTLPIPNTQIQPEDDIVYVIMEPDREIPEKRFIPWYQRVTEGRVRIRKEKIGILILETWMKPALATINNLPIYQKTIIEQMCW